MRRVLAAVLVAFLAVPTLALAQSQPQAQSLEDIRLEVTQLSQTVQTLRTELLSTGNTGVAPDSVGTVLQRLNALESELSAALGRVETLENRVQKISEDATRRIGDIEFRLTELEGGDTSTLGRTVPLGGETSTTTPAGPQLATDEQRSFDAAKTQLDAGNFQAAADAFGTFITDYPGGPLTSEAQYRRGLAFVGIADWASAARSFLDSFSGTPDGDYAAVSLMELAGSLGALGQTEQACLTYDEIGVRYTDKIPELADRIASDKLKFSCP